MSQPRNTGRRGRLLLGLDLGSVSVDTVVLDPDAGWLLLADYTRTRGRPLAVAEEVLSRVFEQFPREDFRACAVTGSGASGLGALLEAEEVNEIIAATRGVGHLHPAESSRRSSMRRRTKASAEKARNHIGAAR